MSFILCLETSTEVCSVALVENGNVIDAREDASGLSHSKLLTVFIDELLAANKMEVSSLDAIAVSEGPGSYTGLRIGVSAAKGLCYGMSLPLIAISPLAAMVDGVVHDKRVQLDDDDVLIPMIDARRMEVYAAKYDTKGEQISEITPVVVDENTFAEELKEFKMVFFGNGAEKCKSVINNDRAVFVDRVITSAKNMARLATAKFKRNEFVDVAYFEPFYLKSFVATTPKKSILNF